MSNTKLEENLAELLELSKKLREANKDLRNKNLKIILVLLFIAHQEYQTKLSMIIVRAKKI